MTTKSSVLQLWYSKIISRRVDLVGDYAGNELFVVSGDSLLLQCFADPKIDFHRGFQLLHAVYCVERFLYNLKSRKSNFHVVFFDDHESLCVPPSCPSPRYRHRYQLARWAIIRHLQRLVAPDTGICVKQFRSYTDPEFLTYMNDAGVYFIMCHDGAFPPEEETAEDKLDLADQDEFASSSSEADSEDSDSDDDTSSDEDKPTSRIDATDNSDEESDSDDSDLVDGDDSDSPGDDDISTVAASTLLESSTQVTDDGSTLIDALDNWNLDDVPEQPSQQRKRAFRALIYWSISKGYNVALINDIQFKDTKVFSLVLEGSRRRTAIAPNDWFTTSTRKPDDRLTTSFAPGVDTLLDKISSDDGQWTDRDIVTLAAVIHLLQSQEISPEQASLFLLSTAASEAIPLAHRRLALPSKASSRVPMLQKFIETIAALTQYPALLQAIQSATCRTSDMLDGRMLLTLSPADSKACFEHGNAEFKFQSLAAMIKAVLNVRIVLPSQAPKKSKPTKKEKQSLQVLPFDNQVFNEHLAPVLLQVDDSDQPLSNAQRRVFKELTHWHNHKRPIVRKGEVDKADKWALRRNQRFMAEMITYAASLTNASGKVLEPETIVIGSQSASSKKQALNANKTIKKEIKVDKPKTGKKPGQGGLSNKELALQAAAEIAATKSSTRTANITKTWDSTRKSLESLDSAEVQFVKTQQYLRSLSNDDLAILGSEVELFAIRALADLWKTACEAGSKHQALGATVAIIWRIGLRLQQIPNGMAKSMVDDLQSLLGQLNLPPLKLVANAEPRKLPFSTALVATSSKSKSKTSKQTTVDYAVDMPSKEFQLRHCGPYFDRSIDAQADPRVQGFQPDAWQRKVLDAIDDNKSLFVVAPTSAGKTFISFYAMQQVLRASDDGVVVYVAPTKALVNQIAAEIQARFSKSFSGEAKSVWGIHTRDYRINNPQNCQCLVTVPHILQIMLLAPAHAEKKNSWSYRIKRIIFDEVHSIGQSEDGLIWEQLLLQACCPIIALSATVGNPQEFSDWLSSTQKAAGHDLVTVQSSVRYSDLRKFIYTAPEIFEFNGLPPRPMIHPPGLDGSPSFAFVHPVAGLINRSRGIPDDLSLEARDCYLLWIEMKKHETPEFPVDASLDPAKCLPDVIRKVDVLLWEDKLKILLRVWIKDGKSPYDKVVAGLQPVSTGTPEDAKIFRAVKKNNADENLLRGEVRLLVTTLPLLVDLHAKDALPAILFSFDRHVCETMAKAVIATLEESEAKWKESSPAWKRKMAEYEKYQKDQEKQAARSKGITDKKTKKGRDENDDGGSKGDRLRDSADRDSSSIASFDPTAPVEGFHFADIKKVAPSDLEEYQRQLRYRLGPNGEWLVTALARGIGIHHAGMNRKYRQTVELLFRAGYLRVIIATGTLALGINMPCKTVVFSGNSVFLTALNYRQCAGRAGRRGFDLLGNVVFQDLEYGKVCTLLSSRLPDLNGHFPITTSLILRLAILLDDSKQSDFSRRSINAILSQPRLVLGGSEAKSAVLHHLRFSIDYLRRAQLLDVDGAPLNFSGVVSHLYYTESSTWAFHALLKEGYFHALAKNIHKAPKQTGLTLMLVLAHIFGRHPCKRADQEFYDIYVHRSSSVVFLPDLPTAARKVLTRHNLETQKVFETYVNTYTDQYLKTDTDNVLPLTNLAIGGAADPKASASAQAPTAALPSSKVRSSFVALSGHGDDDFSSIHDLCSTVRSKIFLEEAAIPYLPVWNKEKDVPLNAYLYDFYKHGDIRALAKANMVKAGDVWFVLNDFSLILATIVTSLMNYMKLSPSQDGDLTDLMGTGEALEEQRDDIAAEKEEARKQAAAPVKARPAREKVVDSWEDAVGADEMDPTPAKGKAGRSKVNNPENLDEDVDGSGLMNVLLAFQHVRKEFDTKFKAIWA